MAKSAFNRSCDRSDIGMLRFILRALFNRDCDELGTRLIERFGSLSGIFDATAEELSGVSGMTERAAAFFAFARPAFRQALLRETKCVRLCGEPELARYALTFFINKSLPSDHCLLLDGDNTLLRTHRLVEYDRIRDIVGTACRYRARRVVWLCYKPYAARPIPTIERADRVLSVARSLESMDMEFAEYFEYSPFTFFGMKRAAELGNGMCADIAAASLTYDGALPASGIAEYIKARTRAADSAFLRGR